MKKNECMHCHPKKKKALYKEPLLLVALFITTVIISSFFIPVLNPLTISFYNYAKLIWLAVLVGLIIGGIINFYIPKEYISKYLGMPRKRAVFYAVGFGFLMSACSHGILAISMALYKRGASTSSVIAFLLASPWANLAIVPIILVFFGLNGILIILASILIAIVTGLIFQRLEKKNIVETAEHTVKVDKEFKILKDMKKRTAAWKKNLSFDLLRGDIKSILHGSWDLSKMVLHWILIGIFLASFVSTYVPKNLMQQYMGATLLGMLTTLAIAVVMEICSEGTFPIAFELYNKTGALGNAFVFLNAGVATDYTEIGIIAQNIGKRAAIFMLLITLPQILILGYIFNMII